jgi:hypothetical protein
MALQHDTSECRASARAWYASIWSTLDISLSSALKSTLDSLAVVFVVGWRKHFIASRLEMQVVRTGVTGLRTWRKYSKIRDGTGPMPYIIHNYSYYSRTTHTVVELVRTEGNYPNGTRVGLVSSYLARISMLPYPPNYIKVGRDPLQTTPKAIQTTHKM